MYCANAAASTINQMDYLAPLQMDSHSEMTKMHDAKIEFVWERECEREPTNERTSELFFPFSYVLLVINGDIHRQNMNQTTKKMQSNSQNTISMGE